LEKAIGDNDATATQTSIQKILLMQAHSIFIGGLPMLFYGDEVGYTNDYSYLDDERKSYDNRWMHRPIIDWEKNACAEADGAIEQQIFLGTQRLLAIRKMLPAVADQNNLVWLSPHNVHVAGFKRTNGQQTLYCLFNFSSKLQYLTWFALKEKGLNAVLLFDHWQGKEIRVGGEGELLIFLPYAFYLLEQMEGQ
jgi:amylosucrase